MSLVFTFSEKISRCRWGQASSSLQQRLWRLSAEDACGISLFYSEKRETGCLDWGTRIELFLHESGLQSLNQTFRIIVKATGKTNTSFGDCFGFDQRGRSQQWLLLLVLVVLWGSRTYCIRKRKRVVGKEDIIIYLCSVCSLNSAVLFVTTASWSL